MKRAEIFLTTRAIISFLGRILFRVVHYKLVFHLKLLKRDYSRHLCGGNKKYRKYKPDFLNIFFFLRWGETAAACCTYLGWQTRVWRISGMTAGRGRLNYMEKT
jgi:hypothetical protein